MTLSVWWMVAFSVIFFLGIGAGAYILWELQRRGLPGTRPEGRESALSAVNAIIDGRLKRAEVLLIRIARLDRNNVPVNRALAAVYRRQKNWQKALARDRTIVVREGLRDSVRAEALYHLALDYDGLGHSRQALEALEESIRLAPKNGRVSKALARNLAEDGDWGRAYEIMCQRIKPDDAKGRRKLAHFKVEMGQARLESGDAKAARRCFRKAMELHPEGYAAPILMGDAYIESDRPEEAMVYWTDLLRRRTDLFSGLYPRFEDVFFAGGSFDELGTFLTEYVATNRDDPRALVILARYLGKKHKTSEAIRELESALALDPNYIDAHRELGYLLLAGGEAKEAISGYRDLLQHLPGKVPGFLCRRCKEKEVDLFWVCPSCGAFESAESIVSGLTAPANEGSPADALVERISDWLPRKMRENTKRIQSGN